MAPLEANRAHREDLIRSARIAAGEAQDRNITRFQTSMKMSPGERNVINLLCEAIRALCDALEVDDIAVDPHR